MRISSNLDQKNFSKPSENPISDNFLEQCSEALPLTLSTNFLKNSDGKYQRQSLPRKLRKKLPSEPPKNPSSPPSKYITLRTMRISRNVDQKNFSKPLEYPISDNFLEQCPEALPLILSTNSPRNSDGKCQQWNHQRQRKRNRLFYHYCPPYQNESSEVLRIILLLDLLRPKVNQLSKMKNRYCTSWRSWQSTTQLPYSSWSFYGMKKLHLTLDSII